MLTLSEQDTHSTILLWGAGGQRLISGTRSGKIRVWDRQPAGDLTRVRAEIGELRARLAASVTAELERADDAAVVAARWRARTDCTPLERHVALRLVREAVTRR
ncbi:MAG: hypothetical protein NXI31_16845 [bacterium]|nr:hypothetical protein [bacterium]